MNTLNKPKEESTTPMNTPLDIEIAIWYYCSDDPFPRLNAPACLSTCERFVEAGLLRRGNEGGYTANDEAMKVYIDALRSIPLPVQTWAIPQ